MFEFQGQLFLLINCLVFLSVLTRGLSESSYSGRRNWGHHVAAIGDTTMGPLGMYTAYGPLGMLEPLGTPRGARAAIADTLYEPLWDVLGRIRTIGDAS